MLIITRRKNSCADSAHRASHSFTVVACQISAGISSVLKKILESQSSFSDLDRLPDSGNVAGNTIEKGFDISDSSYLFDELCSSGFSDRSITNVSHEVGAAAKRRRAPSKQHLYVHGVVRGKIWKRVWLDWSRGTHGCVGALSELVKASRYQKE